MDNMQCIESDGVNFFATGGSQMDLELDLNYFPHAQGKGINLSSNGQSFQQSYQTARQVFERVKPNTIKFVLIDLSACLIHDDKDTVDFTLILEDYFKLCFENGARPVGVLLPVEQSLKNTFNAKELKTFRDTVNRVGKNYKLIFIDLLDVKPVNAAATTTLLSVRFYLKGILSPKDICAADNDFFNVLEKYFSADYKILTHHIFCKLAYEDFNRLSETLSKDECISLMVSVFSEMTYDCLANLSVTLPKDIYNELMTRIFNITVENILRKDSINVGFYFTSSQHWLGDDLYNLFAQDERFEPTVFLPTWSLLDDVKKYKMHGLNVFEFKNSPEPPTQNIIVYLNPYQRLAIPFFKLENIKVKQTLMVFIPYSFILSTHLSSTPLYNVCWKMFFPSAMALEKYKQSNKFGMPRGVYSGYPKLDVFFKPDAKFHFDWKMVRPDAKKIIWAPHWSIDSGGSHQATFYWNYQFMYEFAKTHPEISWVFKPHPNLFQAATSSKIFPSNKAWRDYCQKWDDLPNARFYTGAYYQDIFATSDGIINDSISFTAEYQYINKPMIFLTRDDKISYNYLIEKILKGCYTVGGKDFDGIAAMIQRVFIEGDDFKAAERKAVFDKYLNYPKDNGMLASEFIYKNIVDELKLPSR